MRNVTSPPVVPSNDNFETVYLVVDDFGGIGRAYRETDIRHVNHDRLIAELLAGQYHDPVQIIAFNIGEGWSRDVSREIAWELQKQSDFSSHDLSSSIAKFVEGQLGPQDQIELPLRTARS